MSEKDRREALKDICQIVKVEGIDSFKILSALDNGDFSDAITFICMMFRFGMVVHLGCSIVCFASGIRCLTEWKEMLILKFVRTVK